MKTLVITTVRVDNASVEFPSVPCFYFYGGFFVELNWDIHKLGLDRIFFVCLFYLGTNR